MAVSNRDRATVAHRGQEARVWAGRGAIRAVGRPDAKTGRTSFSAGGSGGGTWSRRWARSGWNQGKLGLALGICLALALVLWAAAPLVRPSAARSVLVVWHSPGVEQARITAVDGGQWQDFVVSQRNERLRIRQEVLDKARAEMAAAVGPLFDDMKGRLPDYSRWFYFFPTTYRMAFTGIIAVISPDSGDTRGMGQRATDAINGLMRDRFIELVVAPERFGPAVEGKAREVLQHAVANVQTAAETLNRSLATFLADHGRAADGQQIDPSVPVVLSWEVLGVPADATSMPAPPDAVQIVKHDPALNELQSSAGTEGSIFAARQATRRVVTMGINAASTTWLLPALGGFGAAHFLVSPVVGISGFVIGFASELGPLKLRQAFEEPQFNETSERVLGHLRETQTRDLADAVAKRIEIWLGG